MHGQFNIPGLGHTHNMGGQPPLNQGHGHMVVQGHLGVGHMGGPNQPFSSMPPQQFMGRLRYFATEFIRNQSPHFSAKNEDLDLLRH